MSGDIDSEALYAKSVHRPSISKILVVSVVAMGLASLPITTNAATGGLIEPDEIDVITRDEGITGPKADDLTCDGTHTAGEGAVAIPVFMSGPTESGSWFIIYMDRVVDWGAIYVSWEAGGHDDYGSYDFGMQVYNEQNDHWFAESFDNTAGVCRYIGWVSDDEFTFTVGFGGYNISNSEECTVTTGWIKGWGVEGHAGLTATGTPTAGGSGFYEEWYKGEYSCTTTSTFTGGYLMAMWEQKADGSLCLSCIQEIIGDAVSYVSILNEESSYRLAAGEVLNVTGDTVIFSEGTISIEGDIHAKRTPTGAAPNLILAGSEGVEISGQIKMADGREGRTVVNETGSFGERGGDAGILYLLSDDETGTISIKDGARILLGDGGRGGIANMTGPYPVAVGGEGGSGSILVARSHSVDVSGGIQLGNGGNGGDAFSHYQGWLGEEPEDPTDVGHGGKGGISSYVLVHAENLTGPDHAPTNALDPKDHFIVNWTLTQGHNWSRMILEGEELFSLSGSPASSGLENATAPEGEIGTYTFTAPTSPLSCQSGDGGDHTLTGENGDHGEDGGVGQPSLQYGGDGYGGGNGDPGEAPEGIAQGENGEDANVSCSGGDGGDGISNGGNGGWGGDGGKGGYGGLEGGDGGIGGIGGDGSPPGKAKGGRGGDAWCWDGWANSPGAGGDAVLEGGNGRNGGSGGDGGDSLTQAGSGGLGGDGGNGGTASSELGTKGSGGIGYISCGISDGSDGNVENNNGGSGHQGPIGSDGMILQDPPIPKLAETIQVV